MSEFIGTGIDSCFQNQENLIINLPQLSRNSFDTCLNSLKARMNKITGLGNTFTMLRKNVVSLNLKLSFCNSDASCLEQIKVEMIINQIEIPDQIYREVQMAKVLAGLIQINESNSLGFSLAYLMGAGVSLVNSVSDCLRNILE